MYAKSKVFIHNTVSNFISCRLLRDIHTSRREKWEACCNLEKEWQEIMREKKLSHLQEEDMPTHRPFYYKTSANDTFAVASASGVETTMANLTFSMNLDTQLALS